MELKNNGLVIADLHIKKDERFAPEGTTDYRLAVQPMMLLDRMEELLKDKQIGWIGILGDLLDTSACLPQELHVLDKFLARINSWNLPTLIILGQHDVDTNRYEGNDTDWYQRTNVTALIEHYANITYAHNTYGTINAKYSFYISNFSNPLVYPSKYVDVWLTHCSLGFTEVEEWLTDEHNVKFERKFGMMVCGDIHDHLHIGNCWTVGTPYQHKAHEQQTGVIGLIKDSGEKLVFERIPTDTDERRFLRFDPPPKKIVLRDEQGSIVEVDVSHANVLEQIESKVEELGLKYIHEKISRTGAPNPVNFNFKLNKLKLTNYKSCKNLELDFNSFKKTLFLQGRYGSGKSTIVEAIRDVFFGDTKTIDSKVMYGADNCRLQVELTYENKEYVIVRGKSLLEFYINGEQQTAHNMKGLEALITLNLPFVEWLYLFLPHSNERLFDANKGLELFQRCFNLDIFDYYLDEAVKLKKIFNETNNATFTNIKVKEGERNILQAEVDRAKNNIEDSEQTIDKKKSLEVLTNEKAKLVDRQKKLISIDSTITELETQKDNIKLATQSKEELKKELLEYQTKLEDIKQDIEKQQERELLIKEFQNMREQKELLVKSYKEVTIEVNEPKEILVAKKTDIEKKSRNIWQEYTKAETEKKNQEQLLKRLEKGIAEGDYKCPECGQRVVKDVSDLKKQAVEVKDKIKSIGDTLLEIEKEIELNKKKQQKIEEALSSIDTIENNKKIKEQIIGINKKGKAVKDKIDAIQIKYSKQELPDCQAKIRSLESGIADIEKKEQIEKRIAGLTQEKENLFIPDIDQTVETLDKQIALWVVYEEYHKELALKQQALDKCMGEIDALSAIYKEGQKQLTDWDTYISLMDYNNLDSIPYKLINLLVSNFNTDSFKISTSRTQKNKKEKFVIDLLIRDANSKYWVPYVSQSGGQKLLSDLYLYDSIAKFMGGIGILSLDENLNTASIDLYPVLNDIISGLSFNNIILVSHSQQISSYDRKLTVYLNEKHESCYS